MGSVSLRTHGVTLAVNAGDAQLFLALANISLAAYTGSN